MISQCNLCSNASQKKKNQANTDKKIEEYAALLFWATHLFVLLLVIFSAEYNEAGRSVVRIRYPNIDATNRNITIVVLLLLTQC